MVEQNELKTRIGTEEAVTLKPGIVKIVEVKVEELGTNKSKKVICMCKHPDADDPIQISAIKYEKKEKLVTVGLWVNKDKEDFIQKNSALAAFMNFCDVATPEELKGKELKTITDDNSGYLVFKGY